MRDRDRRGRTAVITGAASGIGLAIARHAAQQGMRLVLADVDEESLATAADDLRQQGTDLQVVRTDVADARAVEALAAHTEATYGAVHLLVNNAGVAAGGRAWDASPADWDWVLGVNLLGVVHGVRSFVPRMLALSEHLAHALRFAEAPIGETALCPGWVNTRILAFRAIAAGSLYAFTDRDNTPAMQDRAAALQAAMDALP